MTDILCSDSRHASRSAEPDWQDVVGTTTAQAAPTGMLCAACARLNHDDVQAAKILRFREIDARTVELIELGFEFPPGSGQVFSLSREAQALLLGANQTRDDPAFVYPVEWNTIDDNGVYSIPDSTTLHNFYLQAVGTVRARRDSGTAIKSLVRAATTAAEVRAVEDTR